METCSKYAPKASLGPFFNLVNNQIYHRMPVPFNVQDYKGPGTSDYLLSRLQNKFRKIPLLFMYYLTKFDDEVFELHQKLHIFNYSTFICLFKPGKCGKEGKILQKFEYIKSKKSFVDKIKSIFLSF